MPRYSLSELAARDIENIYKRGVIEFGEAQADRYHDELHQTFGMLALFPLTGGERPTHEAPIRVQPKAAHLIVYEPSAHGVHIVRVFHRSQDWQSIY